MGRLFSVASPAVATPADSTVIIKQRDWELKEPRPRPLTVRSYGMTDTGRVRAANEDQFLMGALGEAFLVQRTSTGKSRINFGSERGYLFVVADGMGGHAGGERASALLTDRIQSFMVDSLHQGSLPEGTTGDVWLAALQDCLQEADAMLREEAHKDPRLRGMGTTVTIACTFQDNLYVIHVGDGRCYRLRNGELIQLTQDHTLTQDMIRLGELTAAEAATHPLRHVVTNAVGGTEPGVQPDILKDLLEPDDCLLLCSDGLTEMVPEEEIAAILRNEPDPRRACELLVATANNRGGRDNVTVIVARYDEVTG